MAEAVDRDLIASVARDTVSRVAPEELILFSVASQAYFKDPGRVAKGRGQDDMLGFGGGVDVTFLTPVVLFLATEVVRFVGDELAKAARKEGAAVIANYVHSAFGRLGSAAPEHHERPTLSDAQVAQIRQLAVARAIELDVPADKAAFLADAMIGTLSAASAAG
jgi:hypothetical protein